MPSSGLNYVVALKYMSLQDTAALDFTQVHSFYLGSTLCVGLAALALRKLQQGEDHEHRIVPI